MNLVGFIIRIVKITEGQKRFNTNSWNQNTFEVRLSGLFVNGTEVDSAALKFSRKNKKLKKNQTCDLFFVRENLNTTG